MSNRLTIKGQVTIPKAVRDFWVCRKAARALNSLSMMTVPLRFVRPAQQQSTRLRSPCRPHRLRPCVHVCSGQRAASALPLPRAASHCGVLALLAGRYLIGCPSEWDESSAAAKSGVLQANVLTERNQKREALL